MRASVCVCTDAASDQLLPMILPVYSSRWATHGGKPHSPTANIGRLQSLVPLSPPTFYYYYHFPSPFYSVCTHLIFIRFPTFVSLLLLLQKAKDFVSTCRRLASEREQWLFGRYRYGTVDPPPAVHTHFYSIRFFVISLSVFL